MSDAAGTTESVKHLECMEIWGGNSATDNAVAVAGIDAWVFSQPVGGEATGGDIHFVSTCGSGRIARFAVADVAGHGVAVSDMASRLRKLMRKHLNRLNQTRFARDLNREFQALARDETFATALLASYFAPADHLIVCNAGHPPPLWYRSSRQTWTALKHDMTDRLKTASNLPLGIIEPTDYHQFAVRLMPSDLVLIYTDGLPECRNPSGDLLGFDRFLDLASEIDVSDPSKVGHKLLNAVAHYRGETPPDDDMTLVVLHHNGGRPPRQSIRQMVRTMGKMLRVVKV